MKLDEPFVKLPYVFNHEILLQEVYGIPREAWQKHPGKHPGNYAIPLISVDGGMNDKFAGRMIPTPHLEKMPYTAQVIASFGEVVSRSRIMIIEGKQSLPMHTDINYHWFNRVRIHMPIKTSPDVIFTCHGQEAHLPQGETWLLDTWHSHQVVNKSDQTRIHLVIDTSGSSGFWRTVSESTKLSKSNALDSKTKYIEYEPGKTVSIATEQFNVPFVMSPGEVDGLTNDILADLREHPENHATDVERLFQIASCFKADWRQLYSVVGPRRSGLDSYRTIIENTMMALETIQSQLLLSSNCANAVNTLCARVLFPALNEDMAKYYG